MQAVALGFLHDQHAVQMPGGMAQPGQDQEQPDKERNERGKRQNRYEYGPDDHWHRVFLDIAETGDHCCDDCVEKLRFRA